MNTELRFQLLYVLCFLNRQEHTHITHTHIYHSFFCSFRNRSSSSSVVDSLTYYYCCSKSRISKKIINIDKYSFFPCQRVPIYACIYISFSSFLFLLFFFFFFFLFFSITNATTVTSDVCVYVCVRACF